jgi:hypothetical protein
MALRFGEKISDQSAYDTARAAASDMSNESLAKQAKQENGPNQAQALADEIAARKAQS